MEKDSCKEHFQQESHPFSETRNQHHCQSISYSLTGQETRRTHPRNETTNRNKICKEEVLLKGETGIHPCLLWQSFIHLHTISQRNQFHCRSGVPSQKHLHEHHQSVSLLQIHQHLPSSFSQSDPPNKMTKSNKEIFREVNIRRSILHSLSSFWNWK